MALPTHAGDRDYISDVTTERNDHYSEVFLFLEPPPPVKPLQSVIFNPQLSKEFRDKYWETFGQDDTDSIAYQHGDFETFDNNKGAVSSVETLSAARENFAGYMMKRLAEWHLDNYIKSDPSARPLYELKEQLKNVEVNVTKETKLEMQYNLAGNTLDMIYNNPVCDSKLSIEMDPGSIGPAPVQDEKLILVRPLRETWKVQNTWTTIDARSKLEFIKQYTPHLSSTYGASAAYGGSSFSGESRLALGMTYSF